MEALSVIHTEMDSFKAVTDVLTMQSAAFQQIYPAVTTGELRSSMMKSSGII